MKPVAELQEIFSEFITDEERLITSCGSGLTACILTFAAYLAGHRNLLCLRWLVDRVGSAFETPRCDRLTASKAARLAQAILYKGSHFQYNLYHSTALDLRSSQL